MYEFWSWLLSHGQVIVIFGTSATTDIFQPNHVNKYLSQTINHVTITKLSHGEPLTELLGHNMVLG